MTSAELRTLFLQFFAERGHQIVPSSSLIPAHDPTLLFTNAGMVQFKDVFLGREVRPYTRAVSSQRCVRAGGKHNDLENVGYTARHHTFFEMLGNFSFGDYFKREAIQYAWEFLTGVLKLPPGRLWITVYDQDEEAAHIWLNELKISPERFSRIGTKDNFWSMGDTGPCGPCSEIFYDHGAAIPGGPPGSPEEDGDRYIEIWNLVFMQYDRAADGSLTPLPKPSVDTGMGLERIAAVVQQVHSNYDIDLFHALIQAGAGLAGLTSTAASSLRVLADHIRSTAFLIVDGVTPANEGRGYVLRRIIRRAIRHGYTLGIREVFFYRLAEPLCVAMGAAYPELLKARPLVEQVLRKEEERFAETLEQGMKILEACLKQLQGQVIPGDTVFQLYDTYGFPVDLTADIAREQGLSIDREGFERHMQVQRERARSASHFTLDHTADIKVEGACEFIGYDHLSGSATVLALLHDGAVVESLDTGMEGIIVLEKTPFYAESGGQVGDRGVLVFPAGTFEVHDTRKQGSDTILHLGRVTQGRVAGSLCDARVDQAARTATALNHSATHLLHAALRQILGAHVTQRGSRVDPERLRFDFSHFEPMNPEQLEQVERLVNQQIRANQAVEVSLLSRDEAVAAGAMALFGEKYGEVVRVLRMGDFSMELCGGTHARRVGDIGFFRVVSETGVAAGIRRIEAVTAENADDWVRTSEALLQGIAERLKSGREGLDDKVQQLIDKNRLLEKEIERLKGKMASSTGDDLSTHAIEINGIRVLSARVEEADVKTLRELVDQLRNKLGSAVVILGSVTEGRVNLIAGVTKDQTARIKAGDLVNAVAVQVGGKGGGRPDMAQAGGTEPGRLDAALASVADWIRQQTT